MVRSYINYFTGAFHRGRKSATFSRECGRTGAHTARASHKNVRRSEVLQVGGTILFELTKIKSACEVNIHIFWLSLCGLPAEPDCTEIDDNLRVRPKCKLCRAAAPPHGET